MKFFIDKCSKNLLNLFFPAVCYGCNNSLSYNEDFLCTICRHDLPLLDINPTEQNIIKKRVFGRVKLELAISLFLFVKKGIVQHLLHNLKYKKHQDIGVFCGKWLVAEMLKYEQFKNIDVIIPVPLHKKKLKKRGYNQVHKLSEEIAMGLKINVDYKVLAKTTPTDSQVFKDRLKRWVSNESVFTVTDKEKYEGKHILLVDDIVTTGATLENCALQLLDKSEARLSLATMAIA